MEIFFLYTFFLEEFIFLIFFNVVCVDVALLFIVSFFFEECFSAVINLCLAFCFRNFLTLDVDFFASDEGLLGVDCAVLFTVCDFFEVVILLWWQ